MWSPPGNNNTQSVLGQKYTGLRRTPSTYGNPIFHRRAAAVPNRPPEPPVIMSAPLTPEDIPEILKILEPCPTGPYALRVFQQHSEGLCWQDSLFIMLYNQEWFQYFLLETAAFYLENFLSSGQTDLAYAGMKKIITKNYSNAIPAHVPYKNRPNIEIEVKNLPVKIVPIAAKFNELYAAMGLPLVFWEYYALQLHRYILLAYLFLKHPDTAELAKPMPKSTPLHSRRKSIAHYNYGQLALNFKEVVFRMTEEGMYCSNFKKGRKWFETFVKMVSRRSVSLVDFNKPDIAPGTILGYYIIIHSSISSAKHVVSLFKCKAQWLLYDIDVGLVEFTPEGSAALDSSKMKNLLIENNQEAGVFEYTVTLEDGKVVQSTLPAQVLYAYKLDRFYPDFSMMLVQGDFEPSPNRPINLGYGGGRRTRKGKRSKRRNRTRK